MKSDDQATVRWFQVDLTWSRSLGTLVAFPLFLLACDSGGGNGTPIPSQSPATSDGGLIDGGIVDAAIAVDLARLAGPNPDNDVFCLALSVDERSLYLGGVFNSIGGDAIKGLANVRSSDGATDPTFKPNPDRDVYSLALSGDGRNLYFGGHFENLGALAIQKLSKVRSDGTLDRSFTPNPESDVSSIVVSSDSSVLYVGGQFQNIGGRAIYGLAKLKSDGTVISTFAPTPDFLVESLALTSDNTTLYVGGRFRNIGGKAIRYLAKVRNDGTVDSAFMPNPVFDVAYSSINKIILSMDGNSMYVGGRFGGIGGQVIRNLARLQSDGTVDASFKPNPDGDGIYISDLRLSKDGSSLYVAGLFTTIGGQAIRNLAKLKSDGTVDSSFRPNPDGSVQSIVLSADEQTLYVGGAFTNIGGQTIRHLAKLKSDGTIIKFR